MLLKLYWFYIHIILIYEVWKEVLYWELTLGIINIDYLSSQELMKSLRGKSKMRGLQGDQIFLTSGGWVKEELEKEGGGREGTAFEVGEGEMGVWEEKHSAPCWIAQVR